MPTDRPARPLAMLNGMSMHDSVTSRRDELRQLLGDLPVQAVPPAARKLDEVEQPGYVLETLELDLNGLEPVPAHFVRPREAVWAASHLTADKAPQSDGQRALRIAGQSAPGHVGQTAPA